MFELPRQAVLRNAAMADADRATIQSGRFSGPELMERAGAAVAEVAQRLRPGARVIHILCGPGNNGGDGYVAARSLAGQGATVRLYTLAPPKPGTDAAWAAASWAGAVQPLETFAPQPSDVVIDALFGAGFSGDLPDLAKVALARADARQTPILAVDLPSGIDGDTGLGTDAVACVATVTFYRVKPAHLLQPARGLCGAISVVDIGVRADAPTAIFENGPGLWRTALPRHSVQTHKYEKGAVAVWSGPRLGTGASRLAAMAAQRAGAGAVTILGEEDALDVHAAHVTSIMLRSAGPHDAADALRALKGLGAVVLGPGFGDLDGARHITAAVLQGGCRLVLDADGITAFQADPDALFSAIGQRQTAQPPVLTPHSGEFARLFADLAGGDPKGKLDKALAAAARSGAVMVLKGADTVIAAPDGRAAINTNANAALATAGSGDVLAGLIAGLAAQGMASFEAACAAVWLHGEAGQVAGDAVVAEDLVAAMPTVWAKLSTDAS